MSCFLHVIRLCFNSLKYLTPALLVFTMSGTQSMALGENAWPEQVWNPAFQGSIKTSGFLYQTPSSWSQPFQLFEEPGEGNIHWPLVISDAYGNVHVFWTIQKRSLSEPSLIYYTRKDAFGWTPPIDIVATDPARSPSATIGNDDYIYLFWNGPGGLSYSRAPVQAAEFVRNWSDPILVTESNINAGVATSPSGSIHLVTGIENSGIYEQMLDPENTGWSGPRMISLNSLVDTASDYAQVRVSQNGTLHVVWTEFYYPENWPPRGVFYSRSTDGGNTWSLPQLLAGDGFDQINISLVDEENIHVVWNGMAGVGGRYHRWSSDGGESWSETIEVIPAGIGGTEGYPQIVTDQSGTIHMLTTHLGGCLWYTHLKNQVWSNPVCISGERTLIEEPSLTVSEGNILHAVFWDNRKSLWYTTMVTDAPRIPPKELEVEVLVPTQTTVSTIAPIDTPTTLPSLPFSPVDQNHDGPAVFSPSQLLVISLLPVLLLIFLIIALGFLKKTK